MGILLKSSVAVLILLLVLLSLTCDKSPTGPEPVKDPRTYTWTIDTLAYPGSFQTAMRDIWGSSPNDVYVVGHNDQNRGLMWHFDGSKWSPVRLSVTEGGSISGAIDLGAVFGFAVNDVWIVGERLYDNAVPPPNFLDSSLIIHYDGVQWREEKTEDGRYLQAIWGTSPRDLWTAGWTNRIHHYYNTTWVTDSFPVVIPTDAFFQAIALVGTSSGEIFAIGSTGESSSVKTTHYFFRRRSGNWSAVDSFVIQAGRIENKWGYADLWASSSGTLYSCGVGVHRWNGANWTMLFDHPNFLSRLTGTSDRNIFVVGHFGTVLHYDGQDWYQFRQFQDPNLVLWGVWTNGKEVMIVGHTASYPQVTTILHGK